MKKNLLTYLLMPAVLGFSLSAASCSTEDDVPSLSLGGTTWVFNESGVEYAHTVSLEFSAKRCVLTEHEIKNDSTTYYYQEAGEYRLSGTTLDVTIFSLTDTREVEETEFRFILENNASHLVWYDDDGYRMVFVKQ